MKILLIDNGTSLLGKLQKLLGAHEITKKWGNVSDTDVNSYDLIVLSGSSTHSVIKDYSLFDKEINLIRTTKTPLVGICFGCELITHAFGGALTELANKRHGIIGIHFLCRDFSSKDLVNVYESHQVKIASIPSGFETVATSSDGPEIIRHTLLPIYGLQFHPENLVDQTEGDEIFAKIIHLITGSPFISMNHIDIHGHINFPEYDADREEVIRRAHDAGVGIITVGTGLESSRQAIALAETHDNMWAVVGIHPTDTHSDIAESEFEGIKKLATHPKVVAIGECGLDYFHSKPDDIPKQKALFEKHIVLANEVGKPLMLHVRNAKPNSKGGTANVDSTEHNAYQEAIEIIKRLAKVRANFHFFAGTVQDARDIVEMGNTMSFTGVLTFARNYDEVIRSVPITSIMSETDCPYVAPTPFRGKRCEPVHVIETIKKIAEIRGENEAVVAPQLLNNAITFFRI